MAALLREVHEFGPGGFSGRLRLLCETFRQAVTATSTAHHLDFFISGQFYQLTRKESAKGTLYVLELCDDCLKLSIPLT